MPSVPEDVPECPGHRLMPSPQCQALTPRSLLTQSRTGRQWTTLAPSKDGFPEFKGVIQLLLEAGIMVFPRDQTSPASSAGGHARGPFCALIQLPYYSCLKICDEELISGSLASSPPLHTQSLLVSCGWGSSEGPTPETGHSKR